MATISFIIPDKVQSAFEKAFVDHDKDAIIAELMRRAVREHYLQKSRDNLFRQVTSARSRRPTLTTAELHKARNAGRP
jgi:hypothetical protein